MSWLTVNPADLGPEREVLGPSTASVPSLVDNARYSDAFGMEAAGPNEAHAAWGNASAGTRPSKQDRWVPSARGPGAYPDGAVFPGARQGSGHGLRNTRPKGIRQSDAAGPHARFTRGPVHESRRTSRAVRRRSWERTRSASRARRRSPTWSRPTSQGGHVRLLHHLGDAPLPPQPAPPQGEVLMPTTTPAALLIAERPAADPADLPNPDRLTPAGLTWAAPLEQRPIMLGPDDHPELVPVLAASPCADFWTHAAHGRGVGRARAALDAQIQRAALQPTPTTSPIPIVALVEAATRWDRAINNYAKELSAGVPRRSRSVTRRTSATPTSPRSSTRTATSPWARPITSLRRTRASGCTPSRAAASL